MRAPTSELVNIESVLQGLEAVTHNSIWSAAVALLSRLTTLNSAPLAEGWVSSFQSGNTAPLTVTRWMVPLQLGPLNSRREGVD